MHRRSRIFHLVAGAATLAFTSAAFAQESMGTPPPAGDPAAAAPGGPADGMAADPAVVASDAVAARAPKDLSQPKYGLAARWHYLWIPSSFLKIFATENPGLSTAGSFALEGYRRKADKDNPSRTWEFAVGIGYQSMAPKDAYWLGNGKDPTQDADLVQAKNFYLITMDMGFTSRQYFSRYFGIHYGAGLGLGIVQGKILRTSAQQISDPNNPSNKHYEVRTPGGQVICDGQAKCNETLLSQSETHPPDQGPYQSSRFQETGVPPVIPIVNLMAGLDFPIPDANGLEFRLEFGLFDFLGIFAGATAGYAF